MQTPHPSPIRVQRSKALILFGLVFFLVGTGFLLLSVAPSLYDGWRMQSWRTVPGTLTHARLITRHSSDSTTYEVEARYDYSVNGLSFSHQRVAINSGADNIGSFQQQLGHRLEAMLRTQQPVPVYYNPADPAEAILNRDMRWGLLGFKMIFVLVFGALGGGIMLWAFRGKRRLAIANADDKPWLARPEWQGGVIRSQARGGMIAIWIFALVWNLISAPAAFQFISVWQDEGLIALLLLLFPLVGLGLLYWAVKLTREWTRFGITPLTMDPFPGAIDGDVGGEIRVNLAYHPSMLCRVTLSSIHSYVSGSGKNRSRRESVQWQDEGYARVFAAGANATRLQFRFTTPPGLHATEEYSNSYHLWRLRVDMDLPGTDLQRSFELPVYHTGEKSRRISIDSTRERPAGMPEASALTLLPLHRSGNVQMIDYAMLRKPAHSLMLFLFGALFGGIGILLWSIAAQEGFMLYVMSLIFNLVGWGIAAAGIYAAFNALQVRLDGRQLSSTRSLFGFKISDQRVAYTEIRNIQVSKGMQSQSGHRHHI